MLQLNAVCYLFWIDGVLNDGLRECSEYSVR